MIYVSSFFDENHK